MQGGFVYIWNDFRHKRGGGGKKKLSLFFIIKAKFPFMYANMRYANGVKTLVQAHRNLCLISANNWSMLLFANFHLRCC